MAMPTNTALPPARSEHRTRTALLLESIALRHQIAVLERSGTRRPCFRLWDRLFWILFSRWWPQWRDSLIIVQPETVLRWRREGWSALWRYRARGRWRGGRPRVSREVRHLIVRMARDNFIWGAPRIHGELLMLGFEVAQSTVSKYIVRGRRPPSQTWKTFLRNHAEAIAAIDMCVVPTLTFDLLFAVLVVGHGRRQLLWFDVTRHPTAEWLARQITEAFPWASAPAYLVRDNDRAYGHVSLPKIPPGPDSHRKTESSHH